MIGVRGRPWGWLCLLLLANLWLSCFHVDWLETSINLFLVLRSNSSLLICAVNLLDLNLVLFVAVFCLTRSNTKAGCRKVDEGITPKGQNRLRETWSPSRVPKLCADICWLNEFVDSEVSLSPSPPDLVVLFCPNLLCLCSFLYLPSSFVDLQKPGFPAKVEEVQGWFFFKYYHLQLRFRHHFQQLFVVCRVYLSCSTPILSGTVMNK